MKKNYLYSYLFLTLFFASCKKDISPADLIGDYEAASTAIGTSTKMYVKGKVITDERIIFDFIERHMWTRNENRQAMTAPNWFTFNLSIKKDNRAYIEYEAAGKLEPIRFAGTAEINNNELTVKAFKPDTIVVSGVPYDDPGDKIWKPIQPEDQYKTLTVGTPSPTSTQIISRKKSIFIVKNNELYLPMLATVQKTSHASYNFSSFTHHKYTYFLVNPDLSASLADRDTVVVSEYLIKMIKQK